MRGRCEGSKEESGRREERQKEEMNRRKSDETRGMRRGEEKRKEMIDKSLPYTSNLSHKLDIGVP